MRRALPWLVLLPAVVPAVVAYASMLGLGMHRHAPPWAISLVATGLIFGPPLLAVAAARRHRPALFGGVLFAWSLGVLAALPLYFPGERQQAVVTGFSLVSQQPGWHDTTRNLARWLPEEPALAAPEVPEATALVEAVLPPPSQLEDHQIALPYEGAGRRLSVPVVLENQGDVVETWMMLDTGATYTTLPEELLRALGVGPGPESPVINLQTANGEREAQVVVLDRVWLGDMVVEGVAIATCEACVSADTVGLLGLNVTNAFNLFIDADRREVVFSGRSEKSRRLDVTPFIDLRASLSRYPGGRMEVNVHLRNDARRPIDDATVEIRCHGEAWAVEMGAVAARDTVSVRRRLPEHEGCERYQVALLDASW